MKEYLKIKSMSLAAEARIIRKQENKLKARWRARSQYGAPTDRIKTVFAGLQYHRKIDIRKEARSTSLAYGFLLGREYHEIERFSRTEPNWERIFTLARKYGHVHPEAFSAWRKRGEKHREPTVSSTILEIQS